MSTVKQEVSQLIKNLPDNSSLEDIQYHLYIRQKIEHGLKDIKEGRLYTQAEVERKMKKWLAK